jgi:tetratricopeptide (TPR) repeat protein
MALAVPAVSFVLASEDASGDQKKPAKAPQQPGDQRYDPENITAISQYLDTVAKGNERFQAKDLTGAIDHYKKAVQLSPRHPLGHYLLGEAYVMNNNLAEAEAALLAAQEASDAKSPTLRAHVLFAVADVYERQKKWDQAKTAWQAYSDYAGKTDAGAFPTSAAERMKAIQKVIDLEKAYVAVRARIAAEKDGGADGGKK